MSGPGEYQPLPWRWQGGLYGYVADAEGKPVVLHGRSHLAAANRSVMAAALEQVTHQAVAWERHMEKHASERPISTFTFLIEQWDDNDIRPETILAGASNLFIGKAAFREALVQQPNRTVKMRQGTFVIEDRRKP